jgi:hypothetical protein
VTWGVTVIDEVVAPPGVQEYVYPVPVGADSVTDAPSGRLPEDGLRLDVMVADGLGRTTTWTGLV